MPRRLPTGWLLVSGALCLPMAAWAAWYGVADPLPLALSELEAVNGLAETVEEVSNSARIRLRGDARIYEVSGITGQVQAVENAVLRSGGKRVTLWVDLRHPGGPVWARTSNVYPVFAVAIDDVPVLPYASAVAGYRSNNRLALWMGGAMAAAGGMLLWLGWKQSRR
jgi:hypothetical protein